ncbi:hypothetical protein PG988_016258 [Apiospora saccharicola]
MPSATEDFGLSFHFAPRSKPRSKPQIHPLITLVTTPRSAYDSTPFGINQDPIPAYRSTGSPSGYRLEQGYRDRSSSAQDVLYTARDTKRDEALWALGYDEGHSECPPGQTGTFEQCYNHEHTLPQEGWLASQGTVVEAVGIASLVLREFGLHWLARKGFPGRIAPPSKFSTHWKFGLDGSRS